MDTEALAGFAMPARASTLGWSDIEKFLNLNLLLWAKVVFIIG